MSDEVTFVEGVPTTRVGRGRSKHWDKVAKELAAHPGQWAIIQRDARDATLASRITRGQIRAFDQGLYEAAARKKGEAYVIYARAVEIQ